MRNQSNLSGNQRICFCWKGRIHMNPLAPLAEMTKITLISIKTYVESTDGTLRIVCSSLNITNKDQQISGGEVCAIFIFTTVIWNWVLFLAPVFSYRFGGDCRILESIVTFESSILCQYKGPHSPFNRSGSRIDKLRNFYSEGAWLLTLAFWCVFFFSKANNLFVFPPPLTVREKKQRSLRRVIVIFLSLGCTLTTERIP